ncbi:hypothetical protein V8E36_008868 [Tilletia maclaganii]
MSMPARPGAITGPAMATYALIRYYCSNMPPQSSAATSPLMTPLLLHIVRLIHGLDPPSPSLVHFRECLRGALDAVPAALTQNLYATFDEWWAALRPSHWCIQQIFLQLDTCMQPTEDPEGGLSMSKVRYVDRRSTFGLFLRRSRLLYEKSDIHQQGAWARMLCEWRDKPDPASSLEAGPSSLVEVPYPAESRHGYGSHASSTLTRMQAFDSYQSALHRGDYTAAKDHMLTFFDHTARGSTREMHQHALLNLAAFHLEMDSPSAAEPALHEAILLARSSKDWECVSACESLLKRVQVKLQQAEGGSQGSMPHSTVEPNAPSSFSTSKERDSQFAELFDTASKLASRGEYTASLTHLLSTPLLTALSMREHSAWQAALWRTWALRARRRGDAALLRRIWGVCPEAGRRGDDWVSSLGEGGGRVGVVLRMAERMVGEYGQAEAGLARGLLETVVPEVLGGDDGEVQGIVRWLYARTLLGVDALAEQLREAAHWLSQALADFERTECLQRQGSVLYYLARLADVRGFVEEREDYARRLLQLEEGGGFLRGEEEQEEVSMDEVLEVVNMVGANVAVGIPV